MEYTPNHHMPQWVKSDRIMMDDFNAAFASIETGLDKAQATAADVLGAAQSTDTRLRTIAADLSRDFYRLAIQQKLQHGTAGITDSMWLNAFNCREDAPGIWCGGSGLALSGKKATVAGIKATAEELSYICTVPGYNNQGHTAAVTFTSDGYSILESVEIYTEVNVNYASTDVDFTIFLYEDKTGKLVGQAGPFRTEQAPKSDCIYARQVNFPLAEGVKYRMEFSIPSGQGYQRVTYFALGTSRSPYVQTAALILKNQPTKSSTSHTITAPAWASGGIGIARWSGSGSVSLAVNGKNLPAVRTRQYPNAAGTQCKETEFQLAALPGASMTLGASIQKGSGNLFLYDVGILWK